MTDFTKMCDVLGSLYANYKEEEEFKDFIDFNDIFDIPVSVFSDISNILYYFFKNNNSFSN